MLPEKQAVIGLLALAFLGVAPVAAAATSLTINMPGSFAPQPLPVQWSQDSISLSQLQSLFGQNPGASQFQIQFPNGMSWNVTPAGIQALYSAYSQKAAALGFSQLPDLSFSSLESTVRNSGMATIPVSNAMSIMQQESDAALSALQTQESSFMNSLPDWLKNILQMIANGFMILYNFARDEAHALFR